jgi:16S rRNA (cytosine1402-N4)-methyltransferase
MPSKGAPNMLPNVLPRADSDHIPVLADEVRELLAVQPGETVVDATFGAGGHARLLAYDLGGRGKLVAIDRDPGAKSYFDRFKAAAGVDVRFLRGDFAVVLTQLAANGVKADAILLDLGISSMQVDRPERGFSYATDAPLDMRMDPSSETTAAQIVNTWDERELVTIFRRFGEERYAAPIARAIVRRRGEQPFTRTADLVDTIKLALPTPARFGEGHPAKRVFQALRIAVNDELGQLEDALPAAVEMLRPGGRLAVISFHSLEDRIVKRFIAAQAKGCTCPPDFPVCVCGKEPALRPLTRKPVRPGAHETDANPRAASARLRAAVRA